MSQQATKINLPKCRDDPSIDAEDSESNKSDSPYHGEISNEELPVESDSSNIGAKTFLNDMKLAINKMKKDKRTRPHNDDEELIILKKMRHDIKKL